MPSKLASWLDREGVTQAELARTLGIHRSNVTFWISGAKRPHLITAARIQLETNGYVPVEEWGYSPLSTMSDGSIAVLGHAIKRRLGSLTMARYFGISPITVRHLLAGTYVPKPQTIKRLNMRLAQPVSQADFTKEQHHV